MKSASVNPRVGCFTITHISSVYTVGKDTHFFECKICGEKKDEAPHDFSTLVGQTNSTCMQNGIKAHYECSACKKLVDENKQKTTLEDLKLPVNPGGHNFGGWIDEIPATTEVFGTKGHKDCTICGRHFDNNGNEITEIRIAKIGTHNVVINGESKFYAHGESITVTANDPAEGKVFKGWQDASGEIVSAEKSYTFEVTDERVLTAVYEDKTPIGSGTENKPENDSGNEPGNETGNETGNEPGNDPGGETPPVPKKKGFSGGAIAGIVIGSVAVAGIGGFAVFWFVIRKKTWADFMAAVKGVFAKKQ